LAVVVSANRPDPFDERRSGHRVHEAHLSTDEVEVPPGSVAGELIGVDHQNRSLCPRFAAVITSACVPTSI
jgi:hypothetical protein